LGTLAERKDRCDFFPRRLGIRNAFFVRGIILIVVEFARPAHQRLALAASQNMRVAKLAGTFLAALLRLS
jgi:hypothetical protein